MPSIVTKMDIVNGLRELGVQPGMALEVHCALHTFGYVEGGAITLIEALKQTVGSEGAIVMPSFRFSHFQPLTDRDKELGLTAKIRLLKDDEERSGMGVVSDTFRKMPDVITGEGLFRVSAWGKDVNLHAQSFQHLIDIGGWALLLGVDIYRLSAMHYVEGDLPNAIKNRFKPPEEARKLYPENEWFIEAWTPPVKPWYTIQSRAYEKGLIRDGKIGDCKCMFLKVKDVIGLYREALQTDPLGLYGLR